MMYVNQITTLYNLNLYSAVCQLYLNKTGGKKRIERRFIAALSTIAKRWKKCKWTSKQNVIYTYNGILFSLKKEGNSDTCYNIYEPYAKWNKPCTKGQILYDSIYIKYLEESNSETENRIVVAKHYGEGGMGSCLMGAEFQFCKMRRVLEIGCTTMWICLILLNCRLIKG